MPEKLSRAELERGVNDAVLRAIAERREERHQEITRAVAEGVTRALATVERHERKEALKEAYKELAREWLADISIWALRAIGIFVLGSLVFFALYITGIKAGWTPPGAPH